MYVSDWKTTAPQEFKTFLQEKTYRAMEYLHIPFIRVETDEAVTMEDCVCINQCLEMKMVKTIFLSNRKKSDYFLFVTTGDKPFRTREFSDALGVSRLSFAPAEAMESMLGTKVGAATIFSALLDTANEVRIVIDREVAEEEWYGCSDGTTTGYMKVKTERIINAFLPYAGHTPKIIA